ncbi:hypothetical protein [Helicobacter sp. 13S00477-4]|uniref:hypothetical protein n=1 Tax=Helicobacter sp. 13S00477-4 TaxID=1905759 RepID=UPI000BA67A61|nr:hypothetical protein [Helicobacter sp. 13S00477-4]PAF50232.1 hypothetical protein BKH44_08545 [Helicobacter sp. 13S00477-4]
MTLIIKNANADLTKAIKGIAKIANAKVHTQKDPSDKLKKAIKQFQEGDVDKYKDFDTLKSELMS